MATSLRHLALLDRDPRITAAIALETARDRLWAHAVAAMDDATAECARLTEQALALREAYEQEREVAALQAEADKIVRLPRRRRA